MVNILSILTAEKSLIFNVSLGILRVKLDFHVRPQVAAAGLEPARPLRTRDFKSPASAIPPRSHTRDASHPLARHYSSEGYDVNAFS